ncbi:hypothetical protein ACCQ41_03155 [Anaerococcus sp. ENR0831]|uniref:Extracellular matrix-binding protein ebh GA module domain-containing protein n=1 Tax=Anaerococcus martiniensis TaxID=3115615 RepID=A0ABW9M920_9FIRM
MKSKKIIIAALSLGLIFAPTKPLVFAADAELAEVDFASKRLNLIHKQEIVTGKTENEYKKIKAISDEALKILNSEKNKKTELEKNIERLKNELEANPSNDRKIEIVTEINNLKSQSDLQNQKIDELDQDYKEKEEKRAHYDSIASPERYLLSDYRSANRDIDIEIADAKYQIRVFRNQGLLEDQERNSFISEINAVSKTENPEDYIKIYESARAKAEQKKAEKLAENPEIEPDNQTPNQNQTTAPNEEELKAAKESAIKNLKSRTNLTEAQVKLFEEEINNVENLEELAEINKKVNEADEKAAKAKEVSEAKDNAKQSLESSEHIDSEQKVIFENQIEEADTIDKILEIENNIKLADEKAKKEKEAQELANSKQILEEKLENTNLSPEQKDAFKDRILNAKNQADLEAIQIDIDQAYEKVKKEKELEANKKSLIEKLNSKENLRPDQKAEFEKQIAEATEKEILAKIEEEINQADENAKKEKASQELENAKTDLAEKLNSKENLRPDQKAEFEKQIVEATDKETLTKIEEEIILAVEVAKKEKEAQELENAKLTLEEKLENTSLSPEQKDAFKNRILNLENHADLEAIKKDIDQADEEAAKAKELAEAKEKAKQSLENAKNINLEQKAYFEKQIEDAETVEQLLEIENNIKLADENAKKEKIAQELANSKQILEEKLENTILTQDQKEEFEKQIVEANDKEALAKIEEKINVAVEVANKEKTAEKLKSAKESAIENLKSKTNLIEDQEKLFEEAISNAENLEELAEINKKVNEAEEKAKQEKVSQELENAKTDLAEKLFATSLSQDQKDGFLEKIHNVTDLEGLEAIDKEIEIASNQVDENIGNETEKDPSNEETPSIPDPEIEKPKDEEKDPSEENPNEGESGSLPENQDYNTTENPDPSNEDPVDDDNELENNPQNPDPDNGNNDSSDTSENVENTPTDDNSANGRENNTADGENPEKTSPEGQRPRNTKITRPIFGNTTPVYRPLENPSYLPSTITINETSIANKDTIELKDDLKYLKKGTYKISDLEAKRDKIEEAIKKNKATVRAIGILEDLAPKTLGKNRAKINALLAQSQRLLAQANYALAEYNYLLSK